MKRMMCFLLLAGLLITPPGSAWAEPAGAAAELAGPEGMARAYFAALRQDGLTAVADFLHPEALARFREILLPLFEAGTPAGNLVMAKEIYGQDATLESVRALPLREFMRRFLETVAKTRASKAWNNLESMEVVGTVREGEVAHVLSRMKITGDDGLTVTKMQVLSARQDGGVWRALLALEVEQMALGFRRIVAGEAARR